MNNSIEWNSKVKLILSDVDETIADVYTEATPEMVLCLNQLLSNEITLFLVSGGGLQSIKERITDKLNPKHRNRILVAHCSGAEVWGFDEKGNINEMPYYGLYDKKMTEEQKLRWREIIDSVIKKYQLRVFPTMPRDKFIQESQADPLAIMLADRGPQITFEFTNSINLSASQKEYIEKKLNIDIPLDVNSYDLRTVVLKDLKNMYLKENIPVSPKKAGVFALDNPLSGVDKTYAIKYVLDNKNDMKILNLPMDIETKPEMIEIWGDKFTHGDFDFLMCKAVSPEVRSIDFRIENPKEFLGGFNIQMWNGKEHLHEGLLEFLTLSGLNNE